MTELQPLTSKDNELVRFKSTFWTIIGLFLISVLLWFLAFWKYQIDRGIDHYQAYNFHQRNLFIAQVIFFCIVIGLANWRHLSLGWPISMFFICLVVIVLLVPGSASGNEFIQKQLDIHGHFMFYHRMILYIIYSLLQICGVLLARKKVII